MQIENMPYPVYCEGSPDYMGVLFSVDLDQTESDSPLYFAVRGKFEIQNEDIMKLIIEEKAGFGLFIECDQTDYYELRPCCRTFEEKIIKAYFANVATITPVIYAKTEIEHYTNGHLIDELQEQDITIPKGGIIAADGELELNISRSQPQTVDAICKLRSGEISGYDIEGDSIILDIPAPVYEKYSKMNRNQKVQVTAMYFPPVLQNIIQSVFIDEYNRENYRNCSWFEAIDQTLKNRNIDVKRNDPYVSMMAILGDLLVDGVSLMQTGEGETE